MSLTIEDLLHVIHRLKAINFYIWPELNPKRSSKLFVKLDFFTLVQLKLDLIFSN